MIRLILEISTDDGRSYSGRILCETRMLTHTHALADTSIAALFDALGQEVREHAPDSVFVRRRRRHANDQVLTWEIPDDIIELMATDPAQGLHAYLRRGMHQSLPQFAAAPEPMQLPLDVGHDALALTHGDYVYLRYEDPKVEDPQTGQWLDFEEACGEGMPLQRAGRWAAVSTQWLLDQNWVRYWIPTAVGLQWLTHEQLRRNFAAYLQQKDEVHEQLWHQQHQ